MNIREIDINNGLKPNKQYSKPGVIFTFASKRYSLDERTFVWLWQKSTSLESFGAKVATINHILQQRYAPKKEVASWDCPHITQKPASYISRAASYRKRGIALRKLDWEHEEWEQRRYKLEAYGQILLDNQ